MAQVTPNRQGKSSDQIGDYSTIFLWLFFLIIFFGGLYLLVVTIPKFLNDFLRTKAEIREDFIGEAVAFIYFVGCGLLAMVLMIVDGEQKRLRKLARRYLSKMVAKDYYEDAVVPVEKTEPAVTSKAAVSVREQASQRPKTETLEDQYRSGEINGTFKEYHKNGELKKEVHYINGKIQGIYRTYYDSGHLEQEAVFVNGEPEGLYKSYYEDGSLHQQKEYKDGKLSGVYKALDEHGVPFFEISYRNNIQHGPDRIYDKSGILQFLDTYEDGFCVNRKTYDEYGQLKFDQDFERPPEFQAVYAADKVVEREQQEKAKRRTDKGSA